MRTCLTCLTCLIPTFAILALASQSAGAAEKSISPEIGVMLEVMSSGKCLDNAGSRKRGAHLQGWKCGRRNLNQRFAIVWHSKARRAAVIRNKLSSLCLDVQRQSKKARARIVQDKCGKAQSQNWEFFKSGTPHWFLVRAHHSGMCLTLAQTKKRDSFFIQTKCNKRNDHQNFKLRP